MTMMSLRAKLFRFDMKKISLIGCCIFLSGWAEAQVLLKNNQGEQLFSPLISNNLSSTLLNLNTASTSLGATYYFTDKAGDPANYHVFSLGVTGKATDGLAPLIKQGQLSPGVSFTGSVTKVRLFAPEIINHKFYDWLSFNAGYAADKYKLYRPDTVFKSQVSSQNFRGLTMNLNYNMVLGKEERDHISISLGYARKNNNGDLTAVDVQDYKVINDPVSGTVRQYGSTQTARQGKYQEFDTYPLSFIYVNLPAYERPYLKDKKVKTTTTVSYVTVKGKTDTVTTVTKEEVNVDNPFFKSLKVGYALYLNAYPANNANPSVSNLGGTIFLVSPDKNNQPTSRIGLNLEFGDFFDVKKANNGAFNRLSIGLTTNFSL